MGFTAIDFAVERLEALQLAVFANGQRLLAPVTSFVRAARQVLKRKVEGMAVHSAVVHRLRASSCRSCRWESRRRHRAMNACMAQIPVPVTKHSASRWSVMKITLWPVGLPRSHLYFASGTKISVPMGTCGRPS